MEVMALRIPENHFPEQSSRRHKILYAAVLVACIMWCALFVSAPFLAAGNALMRKLAVIITLLFSPVCHQAASRSFHLMGHPLAVCIRCSSIYAGFLIGLIIYPFWRRFDNHRFPPRWILIAGIFPSALDFLLFGLLLDIQLSLFRAFAGLILGSIIAFYVIPAVFNAMRIQRLT